MRYAFSLFLVFFINFKGLCQRDSVGSISFSVQIGGAVNDKNWHQNSNSPEELIKNNLKKGPLGISQLSLAYHFPFQLGFHLMWGQGNNQVRQIEFKRLAYFENKNPGFISQEDEYYRKFNNPFRLDIQYWSIGINYEFKYKSLFIRPMIQVSTLDNQRFNYGTVLKSQTENQFLFVEKFVKIEKARNFISSFEIGGNVYKKPEIFIALRPSITWFEAELNNFERSTDLFRNTVETSENQRINTNRFSVMLSLGIRIPDRNLISYFKTL